MIRLLKFLFTGDWHLHKWKIIQTTPVTAPDEMGEAAIIYTRHYCQCEHCGTIKTFSP